MPHRKSHRRKSHRRKSSRNNHLVDTSYLLGKVELQRLQNLVLN